MKKKIYFRELLSRVGKKDKIEEEVTIVELLFSVLAVLEEGDQVETDSFIITKAGLGFYEIELKPLKVDDIDALFGSLTEYMCQYAGA